MACYILELWLHAEMLKLENVSTELWSESWGKNYLLCGCAQLSSRVRSAFAEVQQSFYWSNLNIMVACSREIHLIFQIFSTRKKYINVIKDQNDLHIFYLIHFHHFYWGHMSQMLYAGQSAREIVTFLIVTSSSCTGHSSCTRSMKF